MPEAIKDALRLRALLKQKKPLLFDGAMGTWYALQPDSAGEMAESALLDHPERIEAIHLDYLRAGARLLKTDTFLCTEMLLEGQTSRTEAILCQAVQTARRAIVSFAGEHPLSAEEAPILFADMGPGSAEGLLLTDAWKKQMELFVQKGVSCFLLETLPDAAGLEEAARYLKNLDPDAFLLVSFSLLPEGLNVHGTPARTLLQQAAAIPGVEGVGLNCGMGPLHMVQLARSLCWEEPAPLFLSPNAGYPQITGRRTLYKGSPEYFASKLAEAIQYGAAGLGGCCGTSPEHIRALQDALPEQSVNLSCEIRAGSQNQSLSFQYHDHLEHCLCSGKKIIAVELDPPRNDEVSGFLKGASQLQQAGADLLTIADCPVGRPRADSSLLACKIKRETGMEVLPHMTCRDRNLNAAKALLLGLSMEDVHNVLLITGDPLPDALREEVRSVFSYNSRRLASYVRALGQDGFCTPFRIFGALNVNAVNFDVQLKFAKQKEEAGMMGFLTQPVLSQRGLDNLKRARKELKGLILGGIFPVVSYKNAQFLKNEITGMDVCDEIAERYLDLSRDEAEGLAIRISTEIARQMQESVDGYYLMTPFTRTEMMASIISQIRQLEHEPEKTELLESTCLTQSQIPEEPRETELQFTPLFPDGIKCTN